MPKTLGTADITVASVGGLLDEGDAASYLHTSQRHIRRLVERRELRHVKVGRFVRFRLADLDAFIASNVRG